MAHPMPSSEEIPGAQRHSGALTLEKIIAQELYLDWVVLFHEAFDPEFERLSEPVQDELLAKAQLLQALGPQLGRPHVDTLKGSDFANMKELRFAADQGVWRVAFAFDPDRQAILLVAGDKSGGGEKRFYRGLIARADARYRQHLEGLGRDRARRS
jgi:hypothetical protein